MSPPAAELSARAMAILDVLGRFGTLRTMKPIDAALLPLSRDVVRLLGLPETPVTRMSVADSLKRLEHRGLVVSLPASNGGPGNPRRWILP